MELAGLKGSVGVNVEKGRASGLAECDRQALLHQRAAGAHHRLAAAGVFDTVGGRWAQALQTEPGGLKRALLPPKANDGGTVLRRVSELVGQPVAVTDGDISQWV